MSGVFSLCLLLRRTLHEAAWRWHVSLRLTPARFFNVTSNLHRSAFLFDNLTNQLIK
jgi:hypothetical protein